MKEQSSIFSSQKVAQQFLRLPSAPFHINRAEDSDDIFQQEFSVISPAVFQPLLSGTSHSVITSTGSSSVLLFRVRV